MALIVTLAACCKFLQVLLLRARRADLQQSPGRAARWPVCGVAAAPSPAGAGPGELGLLYFN